MTDRKKIGQKVRFEVFKRDGFRCQYCGQTPPAVVLELDHFVPVAEGGGDEIDNLMTACFDCNRGKGAGDITAPPDSVAEKMRKQQESIEQLRVYNEFLMEQREREDAIIDKIGLHWFNLFVDEKDSLVFGDARCASMRTFLRRLTVAEIMDAIEIAFGKFPAYTSSRGNNDFKTWKYFCGVCWKKIKTSEQAE